MPNYSLKIKLSATKELEKLEDSDFKKVSQLIFSLAENPRPNGYKKLKGIRFENKVAYRVRQGNYRVIYTIKDEILEVCVIKIGNRKDVYE